MTETRLSQVNTIGSGQTQQVVDDSMATGLNRDGVPPFAARRSFGQPLSPEMLGLCRRVIDMCTVLLRKHGIYSNIEMQAAGFRYTNEGDTAACDTCGLRVSQWTHDMKPFASHAQRSPNCEFVRSMQPTGTTVAQLRSTDGEHVSKRQKTLRTQGYSRLNSLVEVNMFKQLRKRTFSHYPPPSSPSAAQMIEAGFFSCNVGDRVICIYCNLICQQWTLPNDDPWETHSTLSPRCPFVLARSRSLVILTINDHGQISTSKNESLQWNDAAQKAACHPNFVTIPSRKDSFSTWSAENVPSADAFVRAGFFYTGTKTIVTCFYCNGSLSNWKATDSPMVEHARQFPQCALAKHLCGADLHQKIQAQKKNQRSEPVPNPIPRNSTMTAFDPTTLSLLVDQQLDLPVSRRLLCQAFQRSTIEHCWTEQLRLKRKLPTHYFARLLKSILI